MSVTSEALLTHLAADRARVDAYMARLFESRRQVPAPRLDAAMRHALLVGGKRLRPLLVYLAGRALGASDEALDPSAAAVELIHA
ncbi:MAG: geranyl transferase, partial [Halomonadaceae bacterium]|nr:geranyl transferase [Halomonadaceae bacterium]